jgi:TatD DNase family protein
MLYINIHTHNPSQDTDILEIQNLFHSQISLSEKNPKHLYSIGIHPWHTNEIILEREIPTLKKYAQLGNIIAIGECGVDKLKGSEVSKQIEIFKAQALLAEELQKPLIVHCVKAYHELLSIHQKIKPSMPWIIHDFNKNGQLANQLIKSGFILSFGKSLNDSKLYISKIFSDLPNESYFLETDEESGNKLKLLYEYSAKIKNISLDELSIIIKHNFERCFKINTDDWNK